MKKAVIAGSASLAEQALKWKSHWEERGYDVLDHPRAIATKCFLAEHPDVFI